MTGKVVALMSMSLDGYVADANDGVAEVFDWYFSGDVEVPTASGSSGMTFHVSPPSADHLRALTAEVGAMLTGRRTFERGRRLGRPAPVGHSRVRRHPPRARGLATARLDRPVRHRRHRERRRSSEIGCGPEVRGGARRPNDPAVPGRRAARRDRHRSGCRVARPGRAAVRPPREHCARPRSPRVPSQFSEGSASRALPCTRPRWNPAMPYGHDKGQATVKGRRPSKTAANDWPRSKGSSATAYPQMPLVRRPSRSRDPARAPRPRMREEPYSSSTRARSVRSVASEYFEAA